MTVQIRNVFTSIANLKVNGLSIRDLNEIPEALDGRSPVLYPSPVQPFTVFHTAREAIAVTNVFYTLHYVFFYTVTGTGRGIADVYPGMMSMFAAIIDILLANNPVTGASHLQVSDVPIFGQVTDPSGNLGWGCEIAIDVEEWI